MDLSGIQRSSTLLRMFVVFRLLQECKQQSWIFMLKVIRYVIQNKVNQTFTLVKLENLFKMLSENWLLVPSVVFELSHIYMNMMLEIWCFEIKKLFTVDVFTVI